MTKTLMKILTVASVLAFIFGGCSLDTEGSVMPYVLTIGGIFGVMASYAMYWKKRI